MAELNRLCDSHLPSAALPASGSRGRPPIGTSQPSGSPALSREATTTKIEVNRVKALLVICKKIAGRPIFAKATTWQALPPLQQHSMFRQNVPNSQNRFSSKAFGLSESVLLILLILPEFATSRCLRVLRGQKKELDATACPERQSNGSHCRRALGGLCPSRISALRKACK